MTDVLSTAKRIVFDLIISYLGASNVFAREHAPKFTGVIEGNLATAFLQGDVRIQGAEQCRTVLSSRGLNKTSATDAATKEFLSFSCPFNGQGRKNSALYAIAGGWIARFLQS